MNRQPPNILFKKREKGGISITNTVPLRRIDEETIRSICHEYRIPNATFSIRCDATVDDIIDIIEGNRIYIPALYILNKIDQITIEGKNNHTQNYDCLIFIVSCHVCVVLTLSVLLF